VCPSSGETTIFMRHLVLVQVPSGSIDGHIVARNMYRKDINMLRKIVEQVGFVYKITR